MANVSNYVLEAICSGQLPYPEGFSPHDCSDLTKSSSDAQYATMTRVVMTFIFSFLSLVGIIGNVLVITVVFKVKGMKTPTNCYLVSLAVSDTLFFIATAPTELSYLHVQATEYVFGSFGCAIFTYLPYLAINSSSLSITAFTVERFIGICHPYRARSICTVKRARLIIFAIWTLSIIYNSPWLYLASVIEDSEGRFCSFKLDRDNWTYKVMFLGDFFTFYTIPMFINCIIYGKIAVTLSDCGDKLKQSVKPKGSTTESMTMAAGGECQISGRRNTGRGKNQVVKMLALVVLVFATCWLPYRAMVMYNSFAATRWDPDWYIFFSKTMIFINCAINPILYNLMSARFRAAFRSLFRRNGFHPGYQRGATHSICQTRVTVSERSRRSTARQTPAARTELLTELNSMRSSPL